MPLTFSQICKERGIKPTGILHVGGCMLEEAQDYKDLGVEKVIWVEAQPPDKRRQERAAQFGHELYEFTALSDRMETVSLRIASNLVSSSILPFQRHSAIYPDIVVTNEIPMVTSRGDEVFRGGLDGIDTLVLDVQGSELQVLNGLGKLLDGIQRVYAEVNLKELYTGCALRPKMEEWMREKGFGNQEFFPVHLEEWGEELFWR